MKSLLLSLLVALNLYAQKMNFFENSSVQNIDYNSFYPAILLKHQINTFHKLPKNPVFTISRSGWDSEDVADPYVLVTADSIYLFYDGSYNNHYSIGYAVRDHDGWNWINRKQILAPDKISWRSYHIVAPTLVPGKQLLLYNGNEKDIETGYQIGLAQKRASWVYHSPKPVAKLNSASWDYSGNVYQDVVYIPAEKKYKMWYSGFTGPFAQIGLMESRDGIKWNKTNSKPVFQLSPGAISPEVIYNGENYTLYFTHLDLNKGIGTKIESVTSNDGITWDEPKIILRAEDSWEGKKLMRPNLSFFEGQIHLYYCAQRGGEWNIGEALAEVSFVNSGSWISKSVKKKVKRIIVKYEQPFQTNVSVKLLKESQNTPIELNLLENRKEIRLNAYQSILNTDIIPPFNIEIELQTENENTSPMIYVLMLEF